MRPRHIAIEGPIGVGKTALVERLARRFEARAVFEPTDNPFLESFYADKAGSAFAAQIWFLISRHQQLKPLAQGELFQHGVVADYMFDKDRVFAYMNLGDSELATYETLFDLLAADVPKPDLVVYLQAQVGTLLDRIRRRGRQVERRISQRYLGEVVEAYDHYFFRYDRGPLLVVDTNHIDPAHEDTHLDDLVARIEAMERGGIEYYRPRPDLA
jgi:deoxyadenosine/deoxycytidine kinase